MKQENLEKNLKCFLTAEVKDGQRVFKIVDGTHYSMRKAHVFYQGVTADKGETISAYMAMGRAIEKLYRNWYARNQNAVIMYYSKKKKNKKHNSL